MVRKCALYTIWSNPINPRSRQPKIQLVFMTVSRKNCCKLIGIYLRPAIICTYGGASFIPFHAILFNFFLFFHHSIALASRVSRLAVYLTAIKRLLATFHNNPIYHNDDKKMSNISNQTHQVFAQDFMISGCE